MSISRALMKIFRMYWHHGWMLGRWFSSVRSSLAYLSFRRPVSLIVVHTKGFNCIRFFTLCIFLLWIFTKSNRMTKIAMRLDYLVVTVAITHLQRSFYTFPTETNRPSRMGICRCRGRAADMTDQTAGSPLWRCCPNGQTNSRFHPDHTCPHVLPVRKSALLKRVGKKWKNWIVYPYIWISYLVV